MWNVSLFGCTLYAGFLNRLSAQMASVSIGVLRSPSSSPFHSSTSLSEIQANKSIIWKSSVWNSDRIQSVLWHFSLWRHAIIIWISSRRPIFSSTRIYFFLRSLSSGICWHSSWFSHLTLNSEKNCIWIEPYLIRLHYFRFSSNEVTGWFPSEVFVIRTMSSLVISLTSQQRRGRRLPRVRMCLHRLS